MGWYGVIDSLANGNLLDFERVENLSYLTVLNHLYYLGLKSVADNAEMEYQNNLRKNKR